MSWLFSQALVEEYSEGICSGGEPCAPLKLSRMPRAYLCSDRMTAFSRLSRFGMTFGHSTAESGAELLMWFREGFPAKTSPLREVDQDLTASAAGCGQKWRGWFARFDRHTCSWKTAQCSLLEDLGEFSETWPRSGLMRRGECFPLLTLEHRTFGKESGSSLIPTPTTQDNAQVAGQYANPKSTTTLGGFVRMFPTATATATAGKGWSAGHNRANTDDRLDYTIEREAKQSGQVGRLNPEFCEWLMGWPHGYSALQPLETDKFLEWQRQHSSSFPATSTETEAA